MEEFIKKMERIDLIYQKLLEIEEAIKKSNADNLNNMWLTVEEACKYLSISKRTLQTYRNENVLGYSQFKGMIYFKVSDINDFMEKNYVKPRK